MKPLIVVLAIAVVAAHVWFSHSLNIKHNEERLTRSVKSELEGSFEDVSIFYDHLDGILEGTVESETQKQAVEDRARELVLAGRIVNRIVVVEKPDPHLPARLTLTRAAGGKIVLRGEVPSDEHKARIGDAVKKLGVDNQLRVNEEVLEPAWYDGMPGFLGQFAGDQAVENASLDANATLIRLKGALKDPKKKLAIIAEAEKLGVSVADELTLIPKEPSRFLAIFRGGKLRLEGVVPSGKISEDLARAAGGKVENQIQVNDHSTDAVWAKNTGEILGEFFSGTSAGELEIDEKKIRLKREVTCYEERDAWVNAAKSLLPGGKLVNEISFPSKPRPFQVDLKRQGETLWISGWLPNPDLKKGILEAIRKKFPKIKIEEEILTAPNVTMPDWGAALPRFVAALPAKENFDQVRFHRDGLALPKLPQDVREEWGKIAKDSIGSKFPSFSFSEFGFHFKRSGNNVDLSGWLPNEEIKKQTIGAIKKSLPEVKIQDRVGIDPHISAPEWAGNLPKYFGAIPDFGKLKEIGFDGKGLNLPKLPEPRSLELRKLALSIFGGKFPNLNLPKPKPISPPPVTKKETSKPPPKPMGAPQPKPEPKKVAEAPKPKPKPPVAKPASLTKRVVRDDSYEGYFRARVKNNSVLLLGNVPTTSMKRDLGAAVSAELKGAKIKNEIHVDDRVIPPTWGPGLPALLRAFLKVQPEAAELEIDHQKLRMRQVVANARIRSDLLKQGKTVLPRGRLINQLSSPLDRTVPTIVGPRPVPERNPAPNLYRRYTAYFSVGSSSISSEGSTQILDAAKFYRSLGNRTRVNVKGFTDSQGDPARNKRLSDRRAQAVVDKLIVFGVPRRAIDHIGVGEAESRHEDSRSERRVDITFR